MVPEVKHMIGEESGASEDWTSYEDFDNFEYQDTLSEPLPLPIPTSEPRQLGRFDLNGFLWKYVASGSKTTNSAVLTVLATDPSAQIRRRIAGNPNTSADV